MNLATPAILSIVGTLKKKGYKVFTRPYELNIVGRRSPSTIPNQFDDWLFVFWKDENQKWVGKKYPITTDPGTYWLNNPMNPKGTAILKEGQYVDAYERGLHKGQYSALVQRKPVVAIRDYDRNNILDWSNGKEDKGMHGINIHRSKKVGTKTFIDRDSAGCQVFANGEDFEEFMRLVDKHADLYKKFTYTLIDLRSQQKFALKVLAISVGVIAVGALVATYIKNLK